LSLKIKLFFWLLLKKKILTWDVLLKHGWEGPSICILCRGNQETNNHVFITFPFTREVWTYLEGMMKSKMTWKGNSVDEFFSKFDEHLHSNISLPVVVRWVTLLERNNLLFDNGSTFPLVVASKVMFFYNAEKNLQVTPSLKKNRFLPPLKKQMCWFDGAATGDGKNSGVGGILTVAHKHFIKWTFNLGCSTNNRAELLGVFTTLHLAKFLSLQTLDILGDSKLVINWCNGKGSIRSVALEGWKDRIQELRCHFKSLTFHHTYRDFNKATDTLSKKTLKDCLHVGMILYTSWVDNNPSLKKTIKVF
jgi:ribonuclease HI